MLTLGHHNSHIRVSICNTSQKREPRYYNCNESLWRLIKYILVDIPYFNCPRYIYSNIHKYIRYLYTNIHEYIRLGEPWGCPTSANVRLEWRSHFSLLSILSYPSNWVALIIWRDRESNPAPLSRQQQHSTKSILSKISFLRISRFYQYCDTKWF